MTSVWEKYKYNNDREAKDELIVEYVELVKVIAGRLFVKYNSHVDFEDLLSYGIIGLIDAIEKFDLTKHNKFETYANFRIRGAIVDQIRNLDWIPRSTRSKYKQLEKAIDSLQNVYGQDIPQDVLAHQLGIKPEELGKWLSEVSTFAVLSLEEKIEENQNFGVSSKNLDFQPEEKLMDVETKRLLVECVENLPERERQVISLYYFSELTYKEIASVLEISESRVSQIHSKAIAKMKIAAKEII